MQIHDDHEKLNCFFFMINIGVLASLRVPRLIL